MSLKNSNFVPFAFERAKILQVWRLMCCENMTRTFR